MRQRSRECLIPDSLGPSNSDNRARNSARNGNLKRAKISHQGKDAMAEMNNHPQQMLWFSCEPSLLLAFICIVGCVRSKGTGGKEFTKNSHIDELSY